MRKYVLSLLMMSALFQGFTQFSCVDFDKARYPIDIGGYFVNGNATNDDIQWNPVWNFPNTTKQTRVTNINIGGTGLFRGLMEYKPASYSLQANAQKKYPVIIYFHGGGSIGNGTFEQLCRLFKDTKTDLTTHLSIPGRVERNTNLFTQVSAGETIEYLVISPQFTAYDRGPTVYNFPTADHVE